MAKPQAGMTLVEIMIAMLVLTIALMGLIGAVAAAQTANQSSRELSLAANAARAKVEEMRAQSFKEIYARYNSTVADNPATGVSPGDQFVVEGLNALPGTPVGQIIFPEAAGVVALREDFVDSNLGMPMDLNGDGVIDAASHSGNYVLLPVKILIRWRGIRGQGRYELNTCLYDH